MRYGECVGCWGRGRMVDGSRENDDVGISSGGDATRRDKWGSIRGAKW
jgi:hypothetical protein